MVFPINQSIKQSISLLESMFFFFFFYKHQFIFVYIFFFNNTFGTEVWLHGHCILFNLTELCEMLLTFVECQASSRSAF